MATHSSIPGWKIPWTENPGGPQSMGLWRVRHNWDTNTFTLHFYSWRFFKCTARGGGKVFFSFEAKKENHSSKPSRSDCEIFNPVQSPQVSFFFLFLFLFLQWSKKSKSNPSYRKQDSDGYKGSDLKQKSLLPPTSNICASQKTKITGPENTTARITKIHSSTGGWRQERQVRG